MSISPVWEFFHLSVSTIIEMRRSVILVDFGFKLYRRIGAGVPEVPPITDLTISRSIISG